MNYSMYLLLMMATIGGKDSRSKEACDTDESPNPAIPDVALRTRIESVLQQLESLLESFASQPISPMGFFQLEKDLKPIARELCRVVLEWMVNRLEPKEVKELPSHVHFDCGPYTRMPNKTPQIVSTTFGKIRFVRACYRPTDKTGDPTIFPLAQQLGIVAGTTPALAELASRYQAEAGATQRRTLERLEQECGLDWGTKKLRKVVARVSEAMANERHGTQVEKVQEMLRKAYGSRGRHRVVLSMGRDGITFRTSVKGGTLPEVASVGTISVYDRKGKRVGTVYLAYTPESMQPTMSGAMTELLKEVLRQWDGNMPRLAYVTDCGDNESGYYEKVLKKMRHPRTGEKLDWYRVVDFYHASERVWKMGEAMFGKGPIAGTWARKMLKWMLQPCGIRRVLASAASHHGRNELSASAEEVYAVAYNYLRERTKYMRYAAYKRVGIPCGSGVTEAACKTIHTQRLKQSGMRWTKAGAQEILNLRVLLLSGVWEDAYRRTLNKMEMVEVPPYALPTPETDGIAA